MTMRPVRQSPLTHDDARVVLASARHAHTSRTFSAVSQHKTFLTLTRNSQQDERTKFSACVEVPFGFFRGVGHGVPRLHPCPNRPSLAVCNGLHLESLTLPPRKSGLLHSV